MCNPTLDLMWFTKLAKCCTSRQDKINVRSPPRIVMGILSSDLATSTSSSPCTSSTLYTKYSETCGTNLRSPRNANIPPVEPLPVPRRTLFRVPLHSWSYRFWYSHPLNQHKFEFSTAELTWCVSLVDKLHTWLSNTSNILHNNTALFAYACKWPIQHLQLSHEQFIL